eukprot:12926860-Prorocentrum_lima.AAC.1
MGPDAAGSHAARLEAHGWMQVAGGHASDLRGVVPHCGGHANMAKLDIGLAPALGVLRAAVWSAQQRSRVQRPVSPDRA